MTHFLLSRQWLPAIASDYAAGLGFSNDALNQQAAEDALTLLKLAPWHFLFLVGAVERFASLWCWLYRLVHDYKTNIAQEMAAFEKVPLLAAPLIRLYRSLIAVSWFENADVLATYGLTESYHLRQERFRHKRNDLV